MSLTLGLLTIGQAPRPDGLAHDVRAVAEGVRVIEKGALDGLTAREVAPMTPSADEYRLVTLLSDRTPVQVAKRHVVPRLQAQIEALEAEGAQVTLLMCTGAFPAFRHSVPLIAPQESLYSLVKGLGQGGRVGSLTPLSSQVGQAKAKWRDHGVDDAFVADADPYGPDPHGAVSAAAAAARAAGATVLFMDCFGYDMLMRDAARRSFGGPVVLARSMAARLAVAVAAEVGERTP